MIVKGIIANMKIIIRQSCLFVAFLFFVFVVEVSSQQQEKPLPQAVVESNTHDFGPVFKGEIITHVFRVRNTGDWALELSERRKLIGLARPASLHRDASFKIAPVRNLAAPS
ncbi:MAG: hypothetical protein AB1631_20780 [Acidobacteriota bacterium]